MRSRRRIAKLSDPVLRELLRGVRIGEDGRVYSTQSGKQLATHGRTGDVRLVRLREGVYWWAGWVSVQALYRVAHPGRAMPRYLLDDYVWDDKLDGLYPGDEE